MDAFFGTKIEVKNGGIMPSYDKCSDFVCTAHSKKTNFARFCGENKGGYDTGFGKIKINVNIIEKSVLAGFFIE